MDKIDRAILDMLQDDGRKPFTEIAHTLGVSEGTVRNRVSRLIEDRVLHIVGMVDPAALGLHTPAVVGVTVQPARVDDVAQAIAAFPEVTYLIMVSGEFDLWVEVQCRDRDHLATFLNDRLLRVPGVVRTQTFITLRNYKLAHGAPGVEA